MWMRQLVMLGLICTLGACGSGDDGQRAADNAQAPETGAAAQVAKLDPDLRDGVFAKAIRDSGAACPDVTQSERAEVRQGGRGWKAQCNNDSAHLIEILNDGTAKVTSRTH
jgi:hypothetical protein